MQNAPRTPKRPFLPYLFPRKGKDRAVGDNLQLQICKNQSLRRFAPAPFTQGSLGAGAGRKPPLPGEVARQSRDGEVVANLQQPLSLGCAEPASLPLWSLRDMSP